MMIGYRVLATTSFRVRCVRQVPIDPPAAFGNGLDGAICPAEGQPGYTVKLVQLLGRLSDHPPFPIECRHA